MTGDRQSTKIDSVVQSENKNYRLNNKEHTPGNIESELRLTGFSFQVDKSYAAHSINSIDESVRSKFDPIFLKCFEISFLPLIPNEFEHRVEQILENIGIPTNYSYIIFNYFLNKDVPHRVIISWLNRLAKSKFYSVKKIISDHEPIYDKDAAYSVGGYRYCIEVAIHLIGEFIYQMVLFLKYKYGILIETLRSEETYESINEKQPIDSLLDWIFVYQYLISKKNIARSSVINYIIENDFDISNACYDIKNDLLLRVTAPRRLKQEEKNIINILSDFCTARGIAVDDFMDVLASKSEVGQIEFKYAPDQEVSFPVTIKRPEWELLKSATPSESTPTTELARLLTGLVNSGLIENVKEEAGADWGTEAALETAGTDPKTIRPLISARVRDAILAAASNAGERKTRFIRNIINFHFKINAKAGPSHIADLGP